jgi:G6PDH family F420-dependent oxidoreductase
LIEVRAVVMIGYFLSAEEHDGPELVRMAVQAERAGFRTASISDHFHPWLPEQGQSPFVWSVLGAVARATTDLQITTAVVCPTFRIHPVVNAQAAATTQQLFGGRFRFGIGSGELLNEHVVGTRWPAIEVRLEMLEEAMDVIRQLWTGSTVDHYGRHYTVENARLWTLPDEPPRVVMSAFGAKSVALAARIAEGYYGAWAPKDLIRMYRERGGRGPAIGELKVCWDNDEDRAVATAHRRWRHELVPGLSSELPTTTNFRQAASVVTPEQVRERYVCGPDPDRHRAAIQRYADAGYDEVHVLQIGPRQDEMVEFYRREILPAFA